MKNVLFLGAGNMARALALGHYKLHQKKFFKFFFYTPSGIRAKRLADEVKGEVLLALDDFNSFDYIVIACKPQQFSELALALKAKLTRENFVISIMAGISLSHLKEKLATTKLGRLMPNTPALIGAGTHLFYLEKENLEKKADLNLLLSAKHPVHYLDSEEELEKITGIIASGPAYLFEVARIFQEALMAQGIKLDNAKVMTKELFYGSGVMLSETSEDFQTLREQVTSKGGVTFEGLKVLGQNNLSDIFSQAFAAAYRRNQELKQANNS